MFHVVLNSGFLFTAIPAYTRLVTFTGVGVDPAAMVPSNTAPDAQEPLSHYSLHLEVLAKESPRLHAGARGTNHDDDALNAGLGPAPRRPDDNVPPTSQLKDRSIPPRP